ncbi:uncharacterized protein MYCFIDRAFT_200529 [Pseudocercospora fijiensis CIRAD86]|uniref:Uncharacterized protein n=1 Tax=Pseudocercospora fijiensis (strain CIRAD86) TaxID=383855 RepID=M3AJ41_PSEFD|nr:uncharacterized protein MYCFIDRAFT_200529 [Pseudocercospora fijiensis CIRAD86]EME77497.1 hypothetical protein MYCFIDRAFT_200529 [Pseudocercospora fijiensis CIRAD86]
MAPSSSSDSDTSDGSWSDLTSDAQETWNEIAPVFENLTLDQLINSTGRISWSADSLRTLYKFCSQHQISARNLPSPELLSDLLKLLGAPRTDATAYTNAAKRTVSALTTRISQRNPALTESQGSGGLWKCVWAGWSKRWFEKEDWNGDISMPADVTAAEGLPRKSIPRRHVMGEKALLNALVAFQAPRLTAIRTGNHPGGHRDSSHADLTARITALEGEKIALEEQNSGLTTQNADKIETLEREKASLEARMSSQNTTNDTRISGLTGQVAGLKRQNTTLEKALKDQKATSTAQLEMDLALSRAKNSDLQKQLAAAKSKSTYSSSSSLSNHIAVLKAEMTAKVQNLQAENQVLKEKEELEAEKSQEMYANLLRQDEKVRFLAQETKKLNAELEMYRNRRDSSTPVPTTPLAPSRSHGKGKMVLPDDGNDDASPLDYRSFNTNVHPLPSPTPSYDGGWDAL